MSIQLPISKPGVTPQKIRLNLAKPAKFTVELFWSDGADLDAHALLATNTGGGAKVSAADQILSIFNVQYTVGGTQHQGALRFGPNGKSFATPEGSLSHSGDARTGVDSDVDEIISIDGARLPVGVNEVPIFITIFNPTGATFALVKHAGVRIKDGSGNVLGEYVLTTAYAAFNAVQVGSFVCDDAGWHYAAVGVGFNGDFNTVLEAFS
jgi:tellurium resistance protein TerD